MNILAIVCGALSGYLIGGINPAHLIAKHKGFDIKKRGSGNAGASNAVITMGKKIGAICALLDIFKAFIICFIITRLFPDEPLAPVMAGVGCVMGHIFPVFMHFRGGKGLAAMGGLILAYNPLVFVILLAVELVIVLVVDYICIVPITASVAFPIIYMSMERGKVGMIGAAIYGLMALVVFYKHIENLKRIRNGTEAHFSFLWRRKKEIERLGGTEEDDIIQ